MVYLTIIPQLKSCTPKNNLVADVQLLHSLAHKIKIAYGKPDAIFSANDDICVGTAKVVNLIFGVHGIHATDALNSNTSVVTSDEFITNLLNKAANENLSHVVLILPKRQLELFRIKVSHCSARVNLASKWEEMGEDFAKSHHLNSGESIIVEPEISKTMAMVNVVDVFLNTINTSSDLRSKE